MHIRRTSIRKQIVLGFLLMATIAGNAHADEVIVNVISDSGGSTEQANCISGTGDCPLRAAIIAINNAGSGTHTINIRAGEYLLNLTTPDEDAAVSGDLDIVPSINANVTIQSDSASGATASTTIIDGAFLGDRIFHILATGTSNVTFRNITIRQANSSANGGGILNAMTSSGTVLIEDVIFDDNDTSHATGGGCFFNGSVTSTVTMSTVTIKNCDATNATGRGGGIYNSASNTLIINSSSTISGNTSASQGGGIENLGTLTINNSTITGNTAVTAGAGLAIGASATTTITDSTLSTNTVSGATLGGGAIYNLGDLTVTRTTVGPTNSSALNGGGILNNGTLILINSTISGNAADGHGGGLASIGGTTALRNATIASNSADDDGGASGAEDGGGIYNNSVGVVTLYNTIIADNTNPGGGDLDCSGTVVDGGFNIIEVVAGCTEGGATTNADPALVALTNNGGSTNTHALANTSIAIDAANPGSPTGTPPLCEKTDQREFSRPIDGNNDSNAYCDIGAYEFGASSGLSISGGSCYIATAAYGSGMAADVSTLRQFRDRYLLTNEAGKLFTKYYYKLSPPVATRIAANETLREWARASLIPLVSLSRILRNTEVAQR
ncbi:MAG: CFI-box-CTERM domain-containing protein [Acidiferrobacterales bacterium]